MREWEQDRRKPEGAARVLLTVIEKDPDAVTQALTDAARALVAPVQSLPARVHAPGVQTRRMATAKRSPKQIKRV